MKKSKLVKKRSRAKQIWAPLPWRPRGNDAWSLSFHRSSHLRMLSLSYCLIRRRRSQRGLETPTALNDRWLRKRSYLITLFARRLIHSPAHQPAPASVVRRSPPKPIASDALQLTSITDGRISQTEWCQSTNKAFSSYFRGSIFLLRVDSVVAMLHKDWFLSSSTIFSCTAQVCGYRYGLLMLCTWYVSFPNCRKWDRSTL